MVGAGQMNDARCYIHFADFKGRAAIGLEVYVYDVTQDQFERVKAN